MLSKSKEDVMEDLQDEWERTRSIAVERKWFGREEILKNVWGTDYFGNDRVVDDLIRRVRKKLPKLNINTLYGFGYRLSWNIPN